MLVQVISMRGPEKSPEAVADLFRLIKNGLAEDGIDLQGASATLGDIVGYATYLFQIPDDIPEDVVDKFGKALCMAFMPARWDIIPNNECVEGRWWLKACNEADVNLDYLMEVK